MSTEPEANWIIWCRWSPKTPWYPSRATFTKDDAIARVVAAQLNMGGLVEFKAMPSGVDPNADAA